MRTHTNERPRSIAGTLAAALVAACGSSGGATSDRCGDTNGEEPLAELPVLDEPCAIEPDTP
ncbi:MAG TPA: hypothetical protein VFG69_17245, partial [Nannocystaceae bacterium]|nr:hypothetical protein [Nannocystaceae bacterium]